MMEIVDNTALKDILQKKKKMKQESTRILQCKSPTSHATTAKKNF
jgi:hypothetical protein